jgi:hypothetical protein
MVASIAFSIVGFFAHKHESVPLLASFWVLALVGPVYLLHVYRDVANYIFDIFQLIQRSRPWRTETGLLIAFLIGGAGLLISRVTLMVFSVLVSRDFGKLDLQEKENRLNSSEKYESVDYEGIDPDGDDDGDDGGYDNVYGYAIRDDLTVEDVLRNTYRHAATVTADAPSSSELPDVTSFRNGGKRDAAWW